MKMSYKKEHVPSPLVVMRKAGYSAFTDPKTKKESFVLRLTAGYYPRWHLYLKEKNSQVIFDLHLDQKKASYAGTNMHGGEYEGPAIKKELMRIAGWVKAVKRGS